MDDGMATAFGDELAKIAGLRDLWQRFKDTFRSEGEVKARRRVDYHFAPEAGPDKWSKFVRNAGDSNFVKFVEEHPDADPKLKQHAQGMHGLAKGKTVGKVYSTRLPGRSYEIRKTTGGDLACTCPDWRFKGSVNPGHECKHIKSHRAGREKADVI